MSVESSIGYVIAALEHDPAIRKILVEVERSEMFQVTLAKWKALPRREQLAALELFNKQLEEAHANHDDGLWASTGARVLLFFREFAKIYGVNTERKIRNSESMKFAHDTLFAVVAGETPELKCSPLDIANFRIALSVLCWIFEDENADIFADILTELTAKLKASGYEATYQGKKPN